MSRISQQALDEVFGALEKYISEVSDAPLTDNTKATYQLHATNFVRWLNNDFEPGVRRRKEIGDVKTGIYILEQAARIDRLLDGDPLASESTNNALLQDTPRR